jgi:hypothetical protein
MRYLVGRLRMARDQRQPGAQDAKALLRLDAALLDLAAAC